MVYTHVVKLSTSFVDYPLGHSILNLLLLALNGVPLLSFDILASIFCFNFCSIMVWFSLYKAD